MKIRSTLILSLAAVLIAISSFVFGVRYGKNNQPSQSADNQNTQATQTAIPALQPELLPKEGVVSRIIDGDTVELLGGKVVRFVGANAPEVNEPFHDQALEFTGKLLLNQKVTLEYEKGYEQDKFGRLLAYVFISNSPNNPNLPNPAKETFANLELVKAGLAKVSIYEKRRPLVYQEQLLQAQVAAQLSKLRLWSSLNK